MSAAIPTTAIAIAAIGTAIPTTAICAAISRCPCRKAFIALHCTQKASGQSTETVLSTFLHYCLTSGHQHNILLSFCGLCKRQYPIGRTVGFEATTRHKSSNAYPQWKLGYCMWCQCPPKACLQQSWSLLLQQLGLNIATETIFRIMRGFSVLFTCTGAQPHALSCIHNLLIRVACVT